MIDDRELMETRGWAVDVHRNWKSRSYANELIATNQWTATLSDFKLVNSDPHVENLYLEALEDKAAQAGSIFPFVDAPPVRGTRLDRAEREAQRRRRAHISFFQDSDIMLRQVAFYLDWLMHGCAVGMPWATSRDPRYPFIVSLDPKDFFPVAHDSKGELTAGLVMKVRRVADLEREYGRDHEALQVLRARWKDNRTNAPRFVEEVWYADEGQWAIALTEGIQQQGGTFRYIAPTQHAGQRLTPFVAWLAPPEKHGLTRCPIVENRRESVDGEYRGALDAMIPNLKNAHNLWERLITDIDRSIFGPTLMEGILNPEEYGPDVTLIGDGTGRARIEYPRQPVNFEAIKLAEDQMTAARNVGALPQQRSGMFGASIASAKATESVMGTYNVHQAWAQRDMSAFYQRLLGRLADYDQHRSGSGPKEITGFDEGERFTEKYDPTEFWQDDYRVNVGFHALGLDEHQNLTRLALIRNMGGMSMRTFMRKSGVVDNVLAEEREMALESITQAFGQFLFMQAGQGGNMDPLRQFADLIDADTETARSAVMKVIAAMSAVPTGPGAGGPGGPAAGTPDQAITAVRSLEQGATQPPAVTPDIRRLLGGARRLMAESAPGGSGP